MELVSVTAGLAKLLMPPPKPSAVLPLTVEFARMSGPPLWIPPPLWAWFPLTVELVRVRMPTLKIPPPKTEAEFLSTVERVRVMVPLDWFEMPPPPGG